MSRFSKYVKEKVVKVLVAALVAGSVAGNEGIIAQAEEAAAEETAVVESVSDGNAVAVQMTDTFESASLDNPYAFVVYTDEYVRSNHIESNVAIGSLKAEANIWGGCSYIGDFADAGAKIVANNRDAHVVIPRNNSDGSENKLVELTGQGYTFYVGDRSFITDVKLLGYKYQDDIKEKISQGLEELRKKSDAYYGLPDTENYYQVVYNLTADQFNSNSSCVGNPCNDYTCKIIKAAAEGKTVIINILDAGDVTINEMNDNVTHEGTGYQNWATNVTWNFGKATNVTTHAIFGYVLAPNATVNNKGNVIGSVFCKTLAQEGEIHRPRGGAPVITPRPDQTPTPPTTTAPVTSGDPTPTPPTTTTPVTSGDPTPPTTTTPVTSGDPTPTPPTTTAPVTSGDPTPPTTTAPVTSGDPTPPTTTAPVTSGDPTPTPPTTTAPVTSGDPTPTPPTTTAPVTSGDPTPTPPTTTAPVTSGDPTPTPPTTTTPAETETPTPTPTATPTTPDTPDDSDSDDSDAPGSPADPGTPANPGTTVTPGNRGTVTPEVPQVLGARRRRVVTIEDETAPLADRAVLGASRRPQTGDDSKAWNLGFAFSLTGLGAWLIIKKKEH